MMRFDDIHVPSAPNRGSALVTALLVSVVLTILLSALLGTRVTEIRAVTGTVQSTDAQLVAEAGVDHVLGLVARDDGVLPALSSGRYYSDVRDDDFAGGSYVAYAEPDAATGAFKVVSQGVSRGGVERTVEILVAIDRGNRILQEFGLFTCEDLEVKGNMEVFDGDVYSGGDLAIETSGAAVINGDAKAKGDISFKGSSSITGNVVSKTGTIGVSSGSRTKERAGGYASNPDDKDTLFAVEVGTGDVTNPEYATMPDYCDDPEDGNLVKIPEEDFASAGDLDGPGKFYEAASDLDGTPYVGNVSVTNGGASGYAGQHIIEGDMSISGTPDDPDPYFEGIYFVDGDLTVNGNYSGNATFVVTGNLRLSGNMTAQNAEDYGQAYVVQGDVTLVGNATINGAIYANGSVRQESNGNGPGGAGSAEINGSLVAIGDSSSHGSSGVSGNFKVNYRPTGVDVELPFDRLESVNVQRWRLLTN